MATSTPTEAVHDLLRQIAAENDLDIADQLSAAPAAGQTVRTTIDRETAEQNRRLADLRHAS